MENKPTRMGPSGLKISNESIVEALRQCYFCKADAARKLGISRQWLYKLIENREGLKEIVEDAEEYVLDKAERVLEELVDNRNFQAVKFILETKGKKRGYGNSLKLTGDVTKPITIVTSEMSPEDAARAYMDTIKPDADAL